jgi:hypothetical protein
VKVSVSENIDALSSCKASAQKGGYCGRRLLLQSHLPVGDDCDGLSLRGLSRTQNQEVLTIAHGMQEDGRKEELTKGTPEFSEESPCNFGHGALRNQPDNVRVFSEIEFLDH